MEFLGIVLGAINKLGEQAVGEQSHVFGKQAEEHADEEMRRLFRIVPGAPK